MLNFINNETVALLLNSSSKSEVFKQLASMLFANNRISSADEFLLDVETREQLASTYIEYNVAIPHAKSKHVLTPSIVFATTTKNINYDNDGNTANMFFMLAVPDNANMQHLEILSALANALLNSDFRDKLAKATTTQQVVDIINHALSLKQKSNEVTNKKIQTNKHYDVVAVTACSVGIAHTYIAAENLIKAAEKQGLTIKVQTNGSIGVKNQLTVLDIKNAKVVIIAADIAVDIGVDEQILNNKPILNSIIKQAVHNPDALISKALALANNFVVEESQPTGNKKSNSSSGAGDLLNNLAGNSKFGFYKDLMSGVSYMIPFIVMGGIFLALSIAFSGITPGKGAVITNSFLKQMNEVGGLAFSMIPVILSGFIAFSIAGRAALAPGMIGGLIAGQNNAGFLGGLIIGFVAGYVVKYLLKIPFPKSIIAVVPVLIIPTIGGGIVAIIMKLLGIPIASLMEHLTALLTHMQQSNSSLILYFILGLMIAFDMGGPLNKVAFLFGALMIVEGIPTIMGVVSVAICIPPLALGLASLIDKKSYSSEERVAGKAAIFLGLIGITEGAIPFAAIDPFRVIPAIMLGSGIGALVGGIFQVADYAPHGGAIVLPVVSHKLAWCLAAVIGIIVTNLTLFLLKRVKFSKTIIVK